MKLWQILKAENKGKQYKSSAGVIYKLTVDADNVPLLVNDKNIALPFTQREVFSLEFKEIAPFTGWERVGEGNQYYFITHGSRIELDTDDDTAIDDLCYKNCNYFSTVEKAQEVRNEQELYRRMKKFYDMEDSQIDWNNKKFKYFIFFNNEDAKWDIGAYTEHRVIGTIYFSSYKLAEKCINEVIKPFFYSKGE